MKHLKNSSKRFPKEAYGPLMEMRKKIRSAIDAFLTQTSEVMGYKKSRYYIADCLERQLENYGWEKLHGAG